MYVLSVVGEKFHLATLTAISTLLYFKHFCWFASGSLAYLYFINKQQKYLYFSILICLLELYKYKYDFKLLLFYIFILSVFFIPIRFEKMRLLFNNRGLLFFGLISYPFYLIHENAMIALICKISKLINISYVFLPVIPVIILVFISYIVVKVFEPFISRLIVRAVSKFSKYKKSLSNNDLKKINQLF